MTDEIEAEVQRRLQAVRAVYVTTPEIDNAMQLIDDTRRDRRGDGSAFCSLIYGDTGCGKTRLFQQYVAAQPKPEPGTIPVLEVAAPSPCTPDAWFEALLAAMGEPALGNQKLGVVRQRALRALDRNRVEVILMKEASHITDRKEIGAKVPYYVLDNIKQYVLDGERPIVSEHNPVPVVMSGIKVAARIFEINTQLLTRRLRPVELLPFDLVATKSRERFYLLLELYEVAAGFPRTYLTVELRDKTARDEAKALARRLFMATGGNFGLVANLVFEATRVAVRQRADGLSPAVLALAWARLDGGANPGKNPFLNDVPAAREQPDESHETGLHKAKGKKAA